MAITDKELLKNYEFLSEEYMGFGGNGEERTHLGEGKFFTRNYYRENFLIKGDYKGKKVYFLEWRYYFKDENGEWKKEKTKINRCYENGELMPFTELVPDGLGSQPLWEDLD